MITDTHGHLDAINELAWKSQCDAVLPVYLEKGKSFQAIAGRKSPVRLLAAGRAFRPEREDERHVKVFHQVDGVCIEAGVDADRLKGICQQVVEAVFGATRLRWRACDFGFVDSGMEFDAELGGEWHELGGCGLLKPEMLRQAGFDAKRVSGCAFGLGLERLAMLERGIDDIRKLWREPYISRG